VAFKVLDYFALLDNNLLSRYLSANASNIPPKAFISCVYTSGFHLMLTHLHFIPGYKYSTAYKISSLNCVDAIRQRRVEAMKSRRCVVEWIRRGEKTSLRASELGSVREKRDEPSAIFNCFVTIFECFASKICAKTALYVS
jgi:hypothetical protein